MLQALGIMPSSRGMEHIAVPEQVFLNMTNAITSSKKLMEAVLSMLCLLLVVTLVV